MMELSRHFIENWKKRVGGVPTVAKVSEMIKTGIRVQGCVDYPLKNGRVYRRLAIYWCPDENIILKVDNFAGRAVSLLTLNN